MKKLFVIVVGMSIFFSGCTGCSNTTARTKRNNSYARPNATKEDEGESTGKASTYSKTTIKMIKDDGGVYKVPVEINGTEMYFIFDTGAGMISISTTEANFLYKQGKLLGDDILGKANFIDANGDISEGTIINLKQVRLGNKTLYNIKASVVGNLSAPLLLGQSALQKFGKVSIDYNELEITFE